MKEAEWSQCIPNEQLSDVSGISPKLRIGFNFLHTTISELQYSQKNDNYPSDFYSNRKENKVNKAKGPQM